MSSLVSTKYSSLNSTEMVTVHHRCHVAPPPSSIEEAEWRLPLTYFDMIWLYFHPVQRLLFYKYPISTPEFLKTIVPNLKESLSQALRHYLPIAGNLIFPPDSGHPELRYVTGDSIPVTFAEASEACNFDHLISNQARDADQFYPFVPELPEYRIESESGLKIVPLVAIQVTIFPETGILIGFTNHHVVGDARSIVGFIKGWSSIANQFEKIPLPFYDRSLIKDPSNRANIFWNQMQAFQVGSFQHLKLPTNKFRATFILQKNDINKLKNSVLARKPDLAHLSSFTVTTAYVWSCLAKSAAAAGEVVDDDEPEYFGFAVDARQRLEPPAPAAYFGNCLAFVVAESTHGRVRGEDGFFVAAELVGEVIGKKVNVKGELTRDADEWLVRYAPLLGKRTLGVAGSPKFDLYDTDFGWGKPEKYESVSIDSDGSMALCKSREFEGGLEIGLSMWKKKMDAFEGVFSGGLKM